MLIIFNIFILIQLCELPTLIMQAFLIEEEKIEIIFIFFSVAHSKNVDSVNTTKNFKKLKTNKTDNET